jgi:NACHT domain
MVAVWSPAFVGTMLRLASTALPILGRAVGDRVEQRRIVSKAQMTFEPRTEAAALVASLTTTQATRLARFIDSPQFGHLVAQAMFCAVGRHDEELKTSIRVQLQESLRHSGAFTQDNLFEATDVIETLIHNSAHAVRASASIGVLKDKTSIALAARVAANAARNSELLRRVGTLSRFDQFAAKLRTSVLAVHGRLRLPTMVRSQTVAYGSLYVPPRLTDRLGHQMLAGTALGGVLDRRLGTVILGDPGAGKSTLAAKLAADLATDAVQGWAGQVPIVLAVREHTASLRTEHQTLLHYLEAACRKPYGLTPPPYAVEYLLLNGLATVIVDGVDELGDSHFRVSFAQMVDAFASQYPLTPIVVSSRIIGYDEAPLSEELFTTYWVAPFTDDQVAQYATAWFALNAGPGHRRDPNLSAAFLRESAESRDLRANPLMLSLLCALYSSEGYIPRNRPAVYERCAELLFDTWDRSRGIEVPHHSGHPSGPPSSIWPGGSSPTPTVGRPCHDLRSSGFSPTKCWSSVTPTPTTPARPRTSSWPSVPAGPGS